MKVVITDPEAFSGIKPDILSRHLIANGWREARRIENEFFVYSKLNQQGSQQLVWIPVTDQYSDYPSVIARAIRGVTEVEGQSELQLLDSLETVAIGDVIHVTSSDLLNVHFHNIPLEEGAALIERARRMATAAAASVDNKRAVHPKKTSSKVGQFVKDLLLAQTERGSYQIRIIAPISENVNIAQLSLPLPDLPKEIPFSRSAVLELIRGLNALRDAAKDNSDRGRFIFDSFVSAVPDGVSANLCEAVSGGDSETTIRNPIEVNVTWSYVLGSNVPLPTGSIRFEPTMSLYIAKAAKEFRARNPETVMLRGWVSALERGAQTGPGSIRVITYLDGRTRPVRMHLDAANYRLAVDAHKDGSQLSVTGVLVVEQFGTYRLDNPSGLAIIDAPGLDAGQGEEDA